MPPENFAGFLGNLGQIIGGAIQNGRLRRQSRELGFGGFPNQNGLNAPILFPGFNTQQSNPFGGNLGQGGFGGLGGLNTAALTSPIGLPGLPGSPQGGATAFGGTVPVGAQGFGLGLQTLQGLPGLPNIQNLLNQGVSPLGSGSPLSQLGGGGFPGASPLGSFQNAGLPAGSIPGIGFSGGSFTSGGLPGSFPVAGSIPLTSPLGGPIGGLFPPGPQIGGLPPSSTPSIFGTQGLGGLGGLGQAGSPLGGQFGNLGGLTPPNAGVGGDPLALFTQTLQSLVGLLSGQNGLQANGGNVQNGFAQNGFAALGLPGQQRPRQNRGNFLSQIFNAIANRR